jgi:hypothetical protein
MGNSRILAETQHSNYKGNISVGNAYDKDPLIDFARDNGIDVEKYLPLSAIYYNEKYSSHVAVITSILGMDFKDINEWIANKNKPLPVKQFLIDISLEDYLKYMKRFSFMITSHDALIGQEITITEVD